MKQLLKQKCAHSSLNLRILSSTSVPFTLPTVQVPNLALTHTKWITVHGAQVREFRPLDRRPREWKKICLFWILRLIFAIFYFYTGLVGAKNYLKGQCHEIFDFRFFSRISFPQVPEYTIRAVLNFFENSRRFLQLKVCHRWRWHRWHMPKIFNHKSFII